jgi:hypothetical protein
MSTRFDYSRSTIGDRSQAYTGSTMSPVDSDETDCALIRAWTLWFEDPSDEGAGESETLLPGLVAAGYAEVENDRWGFTPKGIARAEELEGEAGAKGS